VESQSQNLYAYVQNSPINWIDPSGHDPGPDYSKELISIYLGGYKHQEALSNCNGVRSSIKSADDILKGASPGRVTKGKAIQFDKSGLQPSYG
jgi:uncharacterized protein RhaS with RHS repeats